MNIRIIILGIIVTSFGFKKPMLQNDKYFEGIVKYKQTFINKTNKYDSVTLSSLAGKSTNLYFKEGNFLITYDGCFTTRLLYREDKNKCYENRIQNDSTYWTNCDQPGQKILNYSITQKAKKVLGIECNELKVFYENRILCYYYNPDTLKINPEWHKQYTYYNENFFSEKMRSIYLELKIEYKDFIVTQTANSFYSKKLDESVFRIPNNPLVEYK